MLAIAQVADPAERAGRGGQSNVAVRPLDGPRIGEGPSVVAHFSAGREGRHDALQVVFVLGIVVLGEQGAAAFSFRSIDLHRSGSSWAHCAPTPVKGVCLECKDS